MNTASMTGKKSDSALPPIAPDHGFCVGERVSMPVFSQRGQREVTGRIEHVDYWHGKRHYVGLVLVGDDKRYYEFHPELAKKID